MKLLFAWHLYAFSVLFCLGACRIVQNTNDRDLKTSLREAHAFVRLCSYDPLDIITMRDIPFRSKIHLPKLMCATSSSLDAGLVAQLNSPIESVKLQALEVCYVGTAL